MIIPEQFRRLLKDRFGALAALSVNISSTAAFEGEADAPQRYRASQYRNVRFARKRPFQHAKNR
jgi:hypothetical protein